MKQQEEEKEKETNGPDIVINYLHHLSNAIQFLTLTHHHHDDYLANNNNINNNSIQHTNAERYMDTIACDLLKICNPKLLSLPIPNIALTYISQSSIFIGRQSVNISNDNNDDATDNTTTTETKLYSRKDILRNILYNLAPIAYDLSIRIATIVIQSFPSNQTQTQTQTQTESKSENESEQIKHQHQHSTTIDQELTLQSFVLFSLWIEYAPQIAPIVSDLFHLSAFTCPFDHVLSVIVHNTTNNDDNNNNNNNMDIDDEADKTNHFHHHSYVHIPMEQMVIISEAIFRIIIFYSKQDEQSTLKSWWEWTKIYSLLGYQHEPILKDATTNANNNGDDNVNDSWKTILDLSPWHYNQEGLNLAYNSNDVDEDENIDMNIEGTHGNSFDVKNIVKRLPNYGYTSQQNQTYDYHLACKWFIGRATAHLINLSPSSIGIFLKKLNIQYEFVPWMIHPWIVADEKERVQDLQLKRCVSFYNFVMINDNPQRSDQIAYHVEEIIIDAPSPLQVRDVLTLHPALVHLGNGIILPRRDTIRFLSDFKQNSNDIMQHGDKFESKRKGLIITPTTSRNLQLLATAMSSDPYPPPILVCGPRGSGKSTLIRELADLCCSVSSIYKNGNNNQFNNDLLELHVDEETDSKTLIGSYAATDIPGEFTWRPGALTSAVRSGKWVLLEDVECCPIEIQAALVKLLEERVLILSGGKKEKCHPNFRIFGTCTVSYSNHGKEILDGNAVRKSVTTAGSGGKGLLHPGLWRKIHVDPLSYTELTMLSSQLYPSLPNAVCSAVLRVFRMLDRSGRSTIDSEYDPSIILSSSDGAELKPKVNTNQVPFIGSNGRHSSVRDLVKLLGRISSTVRFEPGVTYCTESQRILCMAECYDVFVGWNPIATQRREFVVNSLAPAWGISVTAALSYIEQRQPDIKVSRDILEIGRCKISCTHGNSGYSNVNNSQFADTNYALRLMEAAGISISLNESTLLVGETGCGKTTILQRLAALSGHELIVQNLSLQTDSTDLLGGYRPLEIIHVARKIYTDFVDLFVSSFSKTQNSQFLDYVTSAFEKKQWKRLSQCFQRASKMGLEKIKHRNNSKSKWIEFKSMSNKFEKQRIACENGLAFAFTEGALVDAIRNGKWVLLDEINLASSETLQRLCGLLDDSKGSVTLTEKGDTEPLLRHPEFRLFAAMNPATDAGKKDLPTSLRARFTELYVDELLDRIELRSVAARYLRGAISSSEASIENSETVILAVDIYLKCRRMAEDQLVDSSGQRPRFTLRTMCRALSATRCLIVQQKFGVKRALLEGFELGFEGSLDSTSRKAIKKLISNHLGNDTSKKDLDHPGRRPGGSDNSDNYVLVKPFWLQSGLAEKIDFADSNQRSFSRFVLTPTMLMNLRRISRAIACGPWPVLLEGPTSAGKTTLVEYLAARCGHKCVRINNHEHTDVQEYTGSYASDQSGKLCFREGILVQALRQGYWVILDELNLAPSEVLEALNRLLDDNRELYLAEINEVVKPHPNFKLFATQNPSGAYGGRKPLSRAFRNRFVEIHVGEIPEKEMITILEERCKCPSSHAKLLVNVMSILRKRRSKSSVFRGKDGLITPRDLLRWAQRRVSSKEELALEGYMLLAERLRDVDEKTVVKRIIEETFKVDLNCHELYFGSESRARKLIEGVFTSDIVKSAGLSLQEIAPTKSLLRLLTLVERCVDQKEPVLLVGDTGCGKTTVVQLMSVLLNRNLQIVNCHASTETSDLLGGLRPVRGRKKLLNDLIEESCKIVDIVKDIPELQIIVLPDILREQYGKTFGRESKQFEMQSGDDYWSSNVAHQVLSYVNKIEVSVSKLITSDDSIDNQSLSQCEKKRKLDNGGSHWTSVIHLKFETLLVHIRAVIKIYQQYISLFEWIDGPLVSSMRNGDLFLLDEMSLAEDAVLERLNSVLEPSRTLTLAEKGGDISGEDVGKESIIVASENFRVFATMNPGGDFGKRELSPALRSRFTEIWVPAVTDSTDIDLVLEQALSASYLKTKFGHNNVNNIKEGMIDYVNWFNNTICSTPMSTCADFFLSLRDVLAWARFIIDTNISCHSNLGLWAAFIHGAALMHLDGLGLGTGLTNDDAKASKEAAKSFLLDKVPSMVDPISLQGFDNELDGLDESQLLNDGRFGIQPFVIPAGPNANIENVEFRMSAPTTSLNLRRVLRAMQISKPILLEGSPGVGKTSLISALASMSGHTLVRINLSEQTEITDLMGNDLPVPNNENDEVSGASFKWCDGALLRAIKNGHWVLLDELNLASQSVLEGLNSCLDHRASVYIPELGETFQCPPTFRIFAAQNPLAQGGGRKGLPKSFLNRFTKVYVEALTKDDLRGIVSSKFSMIPLGTVEDIVKFNWLVQQDINNRQYGQLGSPWEFNLRDIFRWCDLVAHSYKETGKVDCDKFVDTIYTQRLRSENDRSLLIERYQECFGKSSNFTKSKKFCISDEHIIVGNGKAERNGKILTPSDEMLNGDEPFYLRGLLRPLEAITFCVKMKWPCLLVGPPASGKSTVLRILAESCNAKLEEIVLTPSSDVNELIGTFEQIDSAEVCNRLLCSLKLLVCYASTTLILNPKGLSYMQHLHSLFTSLSQKVFQTSVFPSDLGNIFNQDDILSLAKDIVAISIDVSSHFIEFSKLANSTIRSAQEDIRCLSKVVTRTNSSDGPAQFRWVDGLLVSALEKGHWLHLENVNLCSSSVLDRLNPLMETDGVLILTECGIQDSDNKSGSPRVVKPHPNFRLFLSSNPSFGEISRAMRNRCIEVSFLSAEFPKMNETDEKFSSLISSMSTIDTLDLLEKVGIRSSLLANRIVDLHINEVGCNESFIEDGELTRSLKEMAILIKNASSRGLVGDNVFTSCTNIAYSILNYVPELGISQIRTKEQIIVCLQPRKFLTGFRSETDTENESRLLKIFDSSIRIPSGFSQLRANQVEKTDLMELLDKFAPNLPCEVLRLASIKGFLIANFARESTSIDVIQRFHAVSGYSQELQMALSYLLFKSYSHPSIQSEIRNIVKMKRLGQLYTEYMLYESSKLKSSDNLDVQKMSVIELSFAIFENRVDRSHIQFPIIPMLYPMFHAMDLFIDRLTWFLSSTFTCIAETSLVAFSRFLSTRDRLWLFLKSCRLQIGSSFLGFDESGFLVHWSWLKKSLLPLQDFLQDISNTLFNSEKRQFELIISSIDRELFMTNSDSYSLSNKFWKVAGHPLVPASADDWISIELLRQSDDSKISDNFNFVHILSGNRVQMKLHDLIDCHHPCLSIAVETKLELLSALCMAHWTTTDEINASIRKEKRDYNISKVSSLLLKNVQSAAEELSRLLHLHVVNTSVDVESNKLDLEDLEKLRDSCSGNFEDAGVGVIQSLLNNFGSFQMMQSIEFWCVNEEIWIIQRMSEIMLSDSKTTIQEIQQTLLHKVKTFIDIAIRQTMWQVSDLRPFQTFLWALESTKTSLVSLKHLLRCTYSTMLVISTKHQWCNSYNDLHCISDSLSSPPFWNTNLVERAILCDVSEMFGCDMGSARLQHNVVSASIFRMLGLNGDSIYSSRSHVYHTLENFGVRETQSRKLVQFLCKNLSAISEHSLSYNTQLLFIENIMATLYDSFPSSDVWDRLNLHILGIDTMPDIQLEETLLQCTNEKFKSVAPLVLNQFVAALREAKQKTSDEAIALLSIYVGLISFHLLIPSSPLDPGTKPAAKVLEWESHIQNLSSRLISIRMESGLSNGDFYPMTQTVVTLLEEATHAKKKMINQDKKMVKRPLNVPTFRQLYRETLHFSKTIASIQSVDGLVNALSSQSIIDSKHFSAENNWQCSASAFFNKIIANYGCYEDVTHPFLASLGMIQQGLRNYSYHKLQIRNLSNYGILKIQDILLKYPNTSYDEEISFKAIGIISAAFESHHLMRIDEAQMKKIAKKTMYSFLMATLSHLIIMKSAYIVNQFDSIRSAAWLFGSISRAWASAAEKNAIDINTSTKEESEEEKNERELREQFPDHGKAFNKIIETVEAEAAGEEIDYDDTIESDGLVVDNVSITDQEANLLAEMHYLFYSKDRVPTDSLRIQSFSLMYSAGSLLNHITSRFDGFESEVRRCNSHCFALGLNSFGRGISEFSFTALNATKNDTPDFHKDSNPIEAKRAYKPLHELLHRITQLLRAFPGNAILIAVGQLIETMLRFDINKVPLGKMLTGLEMILLKSQDWEQHASHRVAFGEKLSQVSRLVAEWRKLELQSWSNLLEFRDRYYVIRTRKHWMRLYLLLISEDQEFSEPTSNDIVSLPSWLWKGATTIMSNFSTRIEYKNVVNIEDIVKVLDSFILTAGIGEFNERLSLIESFAKQLQAEYKLAPSSSLAIKSITLTSFHEHYSQFIGVINAEKTKLRIPIEKKLRDEVKLAKWDEQSYYALAESAEKSHMKLMKIVREYDEVLQINVGRLLEENFLSGIRSHSEVSFGNNVVEPVTEIPSNSSMFPQLLSYEDVGYENEISYFIQGKFVNLTDENRIWQSVDCNESSKYIKHIQKYSEKMSKSILPSLCNNKHTYASKGALISKMLCTSIFERIESLRSNGTKPMKQRALVDLLKCLKSQGYSWMKWSVPKEIRDMYSLLQLPSSSLESLRCEYRNSLQESENYFRRCTVEILRLRSEVTMMGSPYMSKREMDLMTGYGDHGLLLLCQQRSIIMNTLSEFKKIRDLINAFDQIQETLPDGQLNLLSLMQLFNSSYCSTLESLQQLLLSIKSIATLNHEEGECYRKIVSILDTDVTRLKQSYQAHSCDLFMTRKHLATIIGIMTPLKSVRNDVILCQSLAKQSSCLPVHYFDSCLDQIDQCNKYRSSFEVIARSQKESHDDPEWTSSVYSLISNLVESSLIAVQNFQKGTFVKNVDEEDNCEDDGTIWSNHMSTLSEWNSVHLSNFRSLLFELKEKLVNKPNQAKMNQLDKLSSDACCLVLKVLEICESHFKDHLLFFRSTAKFEYIKLRLFRVLIAKGYCADDVEEGGDGEGDASNMKFEDDVDGTGMGDGDGKNDVTDEIENEEQLLGLKGDQTEENSNQNKELGEDEADTGMEMENDFDGELFDVPDKKETEDGENEDDEEELDREMGDGQDPNEQVVDEKMWDDDDDDEDGGENQNEEKFEKDSKVSGEALQDEMRTKEDEEKDGDGSKDNDDNPENGGEQRHDETLPKEDGDQQGNDSKEEEEDEMVNDDLEDNYEDKNIGIDVRNDENVDSDNEVNEDNDDVMDLNDDLNLDDGSVDDGNDGNDGNESGNDDIDDMKEEDEQDSKDGTGQVNDEISDDNQDDENEDMDTDLVQNAHHTLGEDDQMNGDDNIEDQNEEEQVEDEPDSNSTKERNPEALGVAAQSGADAIKQTDNDKEHEDAGGDENEEEDKGAGGEETESSNPGSGEQTNGSSGDFQSGRKQDTSEGKSSSTSLDAPNPFRDPGDAEEFWHRKLNVLNEENDNDEAGPKDVTPPQAANNDIDEEKDSNGTFEFTSKDQENTTQVLGEVPEEDASQLQQKQQSNEKDDNKDTDMADAENDPPQDHPQQKSLKDETKNQRRSSNKTQEKVNPSTLDHDKEDNKEEKVESDSEMDIDVSKDENHNNSENDMDSEDDDQDNKVVTDLAQLKVEEKDKLDDRKDDITEYEIQAGVSLQEAQESRQLWSQLSAETNNLSRRLCEKLRLVMEPLVASKLRGDYRTGKRINMKRVIGYIASGYRKDKIWLRRTKPGKRDYRVLLAVDNSESMKAGAGDVALSALATLATGMSQLEIGELGVASFGEEMRLLHPFHAPFTASSGADLVSNFKFDDKRTRTALCVESAMAALESQSDSSCSMQLVFMISDGRIERDSRDDLRRLVREMTERSILLVMIIVEGDKSGNMKMKDSIVNMKEVSFQNGKPKVKHFIDDYPFPYYMILQDMNTLPEVLGDALKQWFEMMAQNKS